MFRSPLFVLAFSTLALCAVATETRSQLDTDVFLTAVSTLPVEVEDTTTSPANAPLSETQTSGVSSLSDEPCAALQSSPPTAPAKLRRRRIVKPIAALCIAAVAAAAYANGGIGPVPNLPDTSALTNRIQDAATNAGSAVNGAITAVDGFVTGVADAVDKVGKNVFLYYDPDTSKAVEKVFESCQMHHKVLPEDLWSKYGQRFPAAASPDSEGPVFWVLRDVAISRADADQIKVNYDVYTLFENDPNMLQLKDFFSSGRSAHFVFETLPKTGLYKHLDRISLSQNSLQMARWLRDWYFESERKEREVNAIIDQLENFLGRLNKAGFFVDEVPLENVLISKRPEAEEYFWLFFDKMGSYYFRVAPPEDKPLVKFVPFDYNGRILLKKLPSEGSDHSNGALASSNAQLAVVLHHLLTGSAPRARSCEENVPVFELTPEFREKLGDTTLERYDRLTAAWASEERKTSEYLGSPVGYEDGRCILKYMRVID